MEPDRDRYRILSNLTFERRPRNVNLGICYIASTSQTSQSDVFGKSLERQCAIWELRIFLRFHFYFLRLVFIFLSIFE
jgi:hypothetical protein